MVKYRYRQKKRIEIKIAKKYLTLIPVIIFIAAIVLILYKRSQPIFEVNFNDLGLKFKHDIRKSKDIPVFPNEEAISNFLLNPKVKNIFLVFKNSTDNSLVLTEGVEIGVKLKLIYTALGYDVQVSKNLTEMMMPRKEKLIFIYTKEVQSYENVGVDEENPTIAIVPPALADKTEVRLEKNVIFVKGKEKLEFELATIKFLLSVIGVKV